MTQCSYQWFTPLNDNDTFYKFADWLNEIKESYMTARYLLFESTRKDPVKNIYK